MHSLTSHFILGYHGCDKEDARRILAGESFKLQRNDYDWLGHGIYFWENNPERAFHFAIEKQRRNPDRIKTPFVIGAVIDLGYCLDMTTQNAIEAVKTAHDGLVLVSEKSGIKDLPHNSLGDDLLLRRLDCEVIEFLHRTRQVNSHRSFDSVRGVFTEGVKIYENAGFYEKTHTQISIRNEACLKEIFIPKSLKLYL